MLEDYMLKKQQSVSPKLKGIMIFENPEKTVEIKVSRKPTHYKTGNKSIMELLNPKTYKAVDDKSKRIPLAASERIR